MGSASRALAQFDTTVVRLDDTTVLGSLIRAGARKVVEARDLLGLYETMAAELGLRAPANVVALESGKIPLPVFWPECVHRRAWAVPLALKSEGIEQLKRAGVKTVWTVAKSGADLSAWKAAGLEVKTAVDLSAADPALAVAERWIEKAPAVDVVETVLSSYQLPFSVREGRLMLPYAARGKEADARRDQMLKLTEGREQPVAYGRWFGDPQLLPLTQRPMAYNVVEPCRHILSVFARHPVGLPQPAKSCFDLEPSDAQLKTWAKEGKILATWVLHSGELSHDDSVLAFQDWSAMTKMKIGSGVHWQRYHFDPDAVEAMHVPVDEGGVLGLVEPVLHSAGFGIMWETAGDPAKIAAMMKLARQQIAGVAGERFAPRGVYCFGDQHGQGSDKEPGAAQRALWQAVKAAGFEYLITSVLPGESRVLFRDGDFVVLNQAARIHQSSPFVRGEPASFTEIEKKLAEAGKPGWLVGAIDTPIHGSPIYVGHPYGGKNPQPRINEFYDYVQKHGVTGKVISATPRTVARYARLLEENTP